MIVVDFAIDDERREHLLGALFAVNMRSFGDTWTEPHIRQWMETAGLGDIDRTPLGPDRWIVTGWVVRPATATVTTGRTHMRGWAMANPEANPSTYLAMSLAITFPFNILFGIPLYYQLAGWLT